MGSFFQRKQYLTDRTLQFRFARLVLMFTLVSCLFTACVIFYSTTMVLSEKIIGIYPQGRLIEIFRSMYLTFGVGLLLVMPIIFYGAIVFSHRIAGPLPKIYRVLRNIGEGQFDEKLVLRKHDELKELAVIINEMAEKLKKRSTQSQQSTNPPA